VAPPVALALGEPPVLATPPLPSPVSSLSGEVLSSETLPPHAVASSVVEPRALKSRRAIVV
jgi:hypothetical protein